MDQEIRYAVGELMHMLANRDYAEIEAATKGTRLTAAQIAEAVREYGATVTEPPDAAYQDLLDVVEVTGARPRRWSVNMPVWTVEEGRSDLTAELTLVEGDAGELSIELDNLHVL